MSDPVDESFLDQNLEEPRPGRQGLPAAYRMRHDAHYVEPGQVSLNSIVEETVRSFDEELRVTESRASLDLHNAPIRLNADARMVSMALQACIGTLVSLIEASGQAGAIHIATRSAGAWAHCEMRQDAYRMSADQFARLADLEWSDRPGGTPAGLALAAATRIAQAHGGALDAGRTESGGCALVFILRG